MPAYSFKHRFIAGVAAGLGASSVVIAGERLLVKPDVRPKRQTVRLVGRRRHAVPGEVVQLYYAMRTKQCSMIGLGICVDVVPIRIRIDSIEPDLTFDVDDRRLTDSQAEQFAIDDGFGSIEDMWLFWRTEHRDVVDFFGRLIKWKPQGGDDGNEA